MPEILIGDDQMVRAFVLWERRFREHPHDFITDVERYTKQTPDSTGQLCADYFKTLLVHAR